MSDRPASRTCGLEAVIVPRASIDRLPYELLTAIFTIGKQIHQPSILPFPFLVSSVNRRWRDIALDCRDLWSHINVSFRAPVEYTRLWFERSRPCQIDIILDAPKRALNFWPWDFDTDNKANEIRTVFAAHTERLRRLTIMANSDFPVRTCIDSIVGTSTLPNLQQLHISAEYGYTQKCTLGAPSLRTLEIDNVDLASFPAFPNLTSLNIQGKTILPTTPEFLHFMSKTTCLTRLLISGVVTDSERDESDTQGNVIHIPSLRFLAFDYRGHSRSGCNCFISNLRAPELEYLEIKGNGRSLFQLLHHFRFNFQNDSPFPRLHTLRLENLTMNTESAGRLSIFFPMVTRLVLDQVTGASLILGNLRDVFDDNPPPAPTAIDGPPHCRVLWPRLRVVVFLNPEGWHTSLFTQVLTDRMEAGFPLQEVQLCGDLESNREKLRSMVEIQIVKPESEPGLIEKDTLREFDSEEFSDDPDWRDYDDYVDVSDWSDFGGHWYISDQSEISYRNMESDYEDEIDGDWW